MAELTNMLSDLISSARPNTTQHPSCHIVIPAAGKGSRFGANLPKQYLPIGDGAIADHTLARCIALPFVSSITVAIAADDEIWPTLQHADHTKVSTVIGGGERSDSVQAALADLLTRVPEHDWVLVHDMARPCVSQVAIQRLFDEVCDCQSVSGGLLALPLNDTVKYSGNGDGVDKTVDRTGLWLAQTPQMFRLGELYAALVKAHQEKMPVTDEASAMELSGHRVKLVMGEVTNIKVTRPDDLALAEFYIKAAKNQKEEVQ